jgi:tight adherence protein B
MKERLYSLSQRIVDKRPLFKSSLRDAGITESPVSYVTRALFNAGAACLISFFGSGLAFMAAGDPKPEVSFFVGFLSFFFVIILYMRRPGHMMKSRAKRIEEGLIFSLHAINIEMESGIRFGQALEDVAKSDYGQFSVEMRQVLEESHKHGLVEALRRSSARNPSRIYRRAMWQIINSIETGSDVRENIRAIIRDLKRMQEQDAQRFGKSMEKQMTLYIMGGIVLPALAVVIIQTISSLGISRVMAGESVYWSLFMVSVAVQAGFIYMIKFKKPSLLSEPDINVGAPSKPLDHLRQLLEYGGVEYDLQKYVMLRALASLAFGLALALILEPITGWGVLPLLGFGLAFSTIVFYTRLVYLADSRGLKAAEYLPDSLRIMAANMKSGIAADQALFMSAKKEFGVLGFEIQRMGTDMIKNLTFSEALDNLKKRIKSRPLHQSINLIGHGLKSGRGLSDALYHIADILQDREYVRQSIATQLTAIRTTVIILVVLCAPVLYSCSIVSGHIMRGFNDRMRGSLPDDIIRQSFLSADAEPVSMAFLNNYIIMNLFATSLMGAIIIGEVTTGRAREGLRYMLIMLFVSETAYLVGKTLLLQKIGEMIV